MTEPVPRARKAARGKSIRWPDSLQPAWQSSAVEHSQQESREKIQPLGGIATQRTIPQLGIGGRLDTVGRLILFCAVSFSRGGSGWLPPKFAALTREPDAP